VTVLLTGATAEPSHLFRATNRRRGVVKPASSELKMFIAWILVDFARRRQYQKRGGDWQKVTLAEGLDVATNVNTDLVAVDQALQELAALDPRKAQVVELRFFGGLSLEETAEALNVSTDTVGRDWRAAKAWLTRELRR
jgi:RNA polymerase sigma-70 factor (ECF subfamily)